MKTIRVTFRNYAQQSEERILNILKNIYWEKPPANWRNFDEDIEIIEEQPRGGDCFELVINDEKFKAKWVINDLQKIKDIRSIEEVRIVNGIEEYYLIS